MKILGITGGVGSGKSRVLSELGEKTDTCIIEADKLAHRLMEPGMPVYHAVTAHFGEEILCSKEPRSIDRAKLGAIVFGDRTRLEELNALSHPLVKEEIKRQIAQAKRDGHIRLFVIEAALLIQDGYREICDEIWYVWADRETRIERLMEQRGYTREKCISMFDSQEPDEYYRKYADFTINNQFSYENSSKQLNVRLNKLLTDDIMLKDNE